MAKDGGVQAAAGALWHRVTFGPKQRAIETGAGDRQRKRMSPKLVKNDHPAGNNLPTEGQKSPKSTQKETHFTPKVPKKWVRLGSFWHVKKRSFFRNLLVGKFLYKIQIGFVSPNIPFCGDIQGSLRGEDRYRAADAETAGHLFF